MTRLHQALRSSDTNALAREIDFPAFQASLKQQINLVVTNKLDRAFDNAMREYRSGSQFVIYLTGQRGETTELILEREGLRWQL